MEKMVHRQRKRRSLSVCQRCVCVCVKSNIINQLHPARMGYGSCWVFPPLFSSPILSPNDISPRLPAVWRHNPTWNAFVKARRWLRWSPHPPPIFPCCSHIFLPIAFVLLIPICCLIGVEGELLWMTKVRYNRNIPGSNVTESWL